MAVDYENPWMYEGKPFTSDDIGNYYGFVYRIINTINKKSILEESTSCKNENPKEENEKLQVNPTGNDTMEALTNLNKTLKILAETLSGEKLSPSTQPLEK